MAVKTFTTGEVLTAADTNTYLANSGLVYLNSTTFTSTTSVALNGWLSSSYDNFQLMVYDLSATNLQTLFVKLRLGTTSSSASYYLGGNYAVYTGGSGILNQNNVTTGWYGINVGTANKTCFEMVIRNATAAAQTQMNARGWADDGSSWHTGGGHTVATAYDGLELTCPVNMTGKLALYGFRKA
jgi:hypothetical protein